MKKPRTRLRRCGETISLIGLVAGLLAFPVWLSLGGFPWWAVLLTFLAPGPYLAAAFGALPGYMLVLVDDWNLARQLGVRFRDVWGEKKPGPPKPPTIFD